MLELHHEMQMALSGDLNGRVCYSNYMTGEIGGVLAEHDDSVESIAFCLKHEMAPYAVSCGMDTNIKIYNLKESKLRQSIKAAAGGGFTKVQFSELDPFIVYASSTTGNVTMLDVRNGNLLRTYEGHAAPINDFVEVIQHKIIVTAGDDFNCNVYDLTKEPERAAESADE